MMDDAAVMIVDRRRVRHSKSPERMLSRKGFGLPVQHFATKRAGKLPFVATAEGRGGPTIRTQKITISPGRCAESRVEVGDHSVAGCNPDVVGQQCVHGPLQPLRGPVGLHANRDGLAVRVYTGICPPCSNGRNADTSGELLKHPFHFALDGPPAGLALPAGILSPIVLGDQKDRAWIHGSAEGRQG